MLKIALATLMLAGASSSLAGVLDSPGDPLAQAMARAAEIRQERSMGLSDRIARLILGQCEVMKAAGSREAYVAQWPMPEEHSLRLESQCRQLGVIS